MQWIAGWGKRIKFTIDSSKVDEDLVNFPVLVNLDTTYSGVFNELGNNYKKISFMNPTTGEEYYCEVERWDSVNNDAQLWVKIPNVSSNEDTEFYMLYDGTHADNSNYIGEISSTAAQKVWDDNFVAVYHLSQDPSTGGACILDSTSNENHGTPNGSMTSSALVDANVGKGLDFDGSDDYVDVGQPEEFSLGNFTITAVSNLEPTSTDQLGIISNYGGSGSEQHWGLRDNVNRCSLFYDDGSSWDSVTGSIDISSKWVLLTGVRIKGSNAYVYINDTLDATDSSVTDTILTPSANTFIGKDAAGSGYYLNGVLKNITISNIVRTSSWIKATYYSNFDQLLIKGQEEIVTAGTLDYENRIKIVIPNYSDIDTLYNFPVLLNLSGAAGKNKADVRDVFYKLEHYLNRKKIAITDYTGVAQLYCEIERWDQVEQSAQLWVRVPEISNTTETVLYLYYDKNKEDNYLMVGDTGSLPATRVWDDNFVAVYHLSQDPSNGGACILDSTSNKNHGTPHGGMTSSNLVDANIGKGLEFDGSDDCINCGNNNSVQLEYTLTPEIIIKTNDDFFEPFSKLLDTSPYSGWSILYNKDNTPATYSVHYINTWDTDADKIYSNTVPNNTYQYIASTLNNYTSNIYINGKNDNNTTNPNTLSSNISTPADLIIGPRSGNSNLMFNGIIQEARLSNIARSESWIKATYYSNFDNFVIYDITPEDTWLKTYENGSLSPWAKRIKLEIDNSNIDEPLEDFPVLINITEDSGINNTNLSNLFNELSNDSLKIAVTDSNNKQLYVEVERWDYTEKSAQLWTKVPFVMPHEKTILYLYYDKNKSDNTDYVGYTNSTAASNVWDDNFVAVYHMSQDPSVGGNCILDSSQHHYNGETINSFSSSNLVNGPIGKAIQFDTVDHFIKLPSTDIIPNNLLTVELIFRQDSDYDGGNGGRIIGKSGEGESVDTNTVRFQHTDSTTILYFCEYGNGTNGATCDITVPDNSTGFHTVAYTLENKQFGVVLDGTTYYSSDTADDTDSTANCFIGPSNSNIASTRGYSTFLGVVREVRTSNIKRSKVWLKATHYSNFDNLIYYGNSQEYTEPPTHTYYFRGTIKEEGKPVQRVALLYDRTSGKLIERTTSGSDGRYTLTTTSSGTHFIVVLDDDAGKQYNALIQDRLIPTNN